MKNNSGIPRMFLHKHSGRARVRIEGKDHYLGPWRSDEAKKNYDRVIAEYLATRSVQKLSEEPQDPRNPTIAVCEIVVAFLQHAKHHYVKNGKTTDEVHCFKSAVRVLNNLHGATWAVEFGPLKLGCVRDEMIGLGWSRGYINKQINRVRHIFKWACSQELIPVHIYQSLTTLQGLQAGRSSARETEARHPVSAEHIDAVRSRVTQRTKDLIDLQLLCGARPGELLDLMTIECIDQSGDVWIANLSGHKTEHYERERRLYFGPKAQMILRKYLDRDSGLVFRGYGVQSYRCAIVRACNKAEIKRWTPHWLRHNAGSQMRDQFGIEAAQAMLGHSLPSMTSHYAKKSEQRAIELAKRIG